MLIKIKAFIYILHGHLSPLPYRHMKVDFMRGGSDMQRKEALLMEMVHVL